MAVYVDQMMKIAPYARTRGTRWRWPEACHMWADSIPELHRFAKRLGLKRGWFQVHPRFPHYDLTAAKRAQAIALGAQEASLQGASRERRNATRSSPAG